jgi:transcription elongation factor GreA
MSKIPITKAGRRDAAAGAAPLKTVERPNVMAAIAEARAHGDLSENAEYDAARERRASSRGASRKSRASWATRRSSTRRCWTPTAAACSARPSTWRTRKAGDKVTYQIVGDDEADIKDRQDLDLLADRARPDRQVRRGHRRGEGARRDREYEILDVRYI